MGQCSNTTKSRHQDCSLQVTMKFILLIVSLLLVSISALPQSQTQSSDRKWLEKLAHEQEVAYIRFQEKQAYQSINDQIQPNPCGFVNNGEGLRCGRWQPACYATCDCRRRCY